MSPFALASSLICSWWRPVPASMFSAPAIWSRSPRQEVRVVGEPVVRLRRDVDALVAGAEVEVRDGARALDVEHVVAAAERDVQRLDAVVVDAVRRASRAAPCRSRFARVDVGDRAEAILALEEEREGVAVLRHRMLSVNGSAGFELCGFSAALSRPSVQTSVPAGQLSGRSRSSGVASKSIGAVATSTEHAVACSAAGSGGRTCRRSRRPSASAPSSAAASSCRSGRRRCRRRAPTTSGFAHEVVVSSIVSSGEAARGVLAQERDPVGDVDAASASP